MFYKLIKEFFNVASGVWLLLVFFEIVNPGMSHRYINLEYYFYGLLFIFLVLRLKK